MYYVMLYGPLRRNAHYTKLIYLLITAQLGVAVFDVEYHRFVKRPFIGYSTSCTGYHPWGQ